MTDFPIETLKGEPKAYITRTARMADISTVMMKTFATLSELFAKAKAPMTGMPSARYITYDDASTTFELGFPCRTEDEAALRTAGLLIGKSPEGRSMTATHIGPYDPVGSTYNAMIAAMEAKGLVPVKDVGDLLQPARDAACRDQY